jgi:hypothetical protein
MIIGVQCESRQIKFKFKQKAIQRILVKFWGGQVSCMYCFENTEGIYMKQDTALGVTRYRKESDAMSIDTRTMVESLRHQCTNKSKACAQQSKPGTRH